MPLAAILETVLYAEDLSAAENFYGGLLGLEKHAGVEGRHIFYKLDNQMLLIFNPDATSKSTGRPLPVPPHGATGQGHICFAASLTEINAWRRKLQASGIDIEADFEWPSGGRSIYIRDPAGNSVEFAEPRIWGFDA